MMKDWIPYTRVQCPSGTGTYVMQGNRHVSFFPKGGSQYFDYHTGKWFDNVPKAKQ